MAERVRREPDWLEVREAITRVLQAVRPLPFERVPTLDALGRTLAEPVGSPIDQPPWDNSAMDGFAVRASDIRGATRERPVRLELLEAVPAGHFPMLAVRPGTAIQIFTGAPIPDGADSVVRIEHTDRWSPRPGGGTQDPDPRVPAAEWVTVFDDADAGRNLRARGEDLAAGDVVLEPGRVLRPADLGVLATVGRSHVRVHRRPRVAILSNGDELTEVDRYDEVLEGRRITDSNSYALAGAVLASGAVPLLLGIARDDEESLRRHLEAARGADVLVTTAGASVGEHDLVKDALERLGFRLDFWRVRMQPGSPVSFGWLGETAVFGLPGNPVSALVTFEVLVRPALRRMAGRLDVHAGTRRVRVAARIASKSGLTRFLRVRLAEHPKHGWEARLTGPQGSGILTSVSRADALLVVPEAMDEVPEGTELAAIPLYPADSTRTTIGF